MYVLVYFRRVHVTQATLEHLRGEYEVEPGNGHLRNEHIGSLGIQTFFIVPPQRRKKTLLFNTLHVRNAMMPSGKRKPSFKVCIVYSIIRDVVLLWAGGAGPTNIWLRL